jgi:hypothetical protein
VGKEVLGKSVFIDEALGEDWCNIFKSCFLTISKSSQRVGIELEKIIELLKENGYARNKALDEVSLGNSKVIQVKTDIHKAKRKEKLRRAGEKGEELEAKRNSLL